MASSERVAHFNGPEAVPGAVVVARHTPSVDIAVVHNAFRYFDVLQDWVLDSLDGTDVFPGEFDMRSGGVISALQPEIWVPFQEAAEEDIAVLGIEDPDYDMFFRKRSRNHMPHYDAEREHDNKRPVGAIASLGIFGTANFYADKRHQIEGVGRSPRARESLRTRVSQEENDLVIVSAGTLHGVKVSNDRLAYLLSIEARTWE